MLKKYNVRKAVLIIVLAFYSVTPVWGAYAKHAFKDTAAAAFFCWFTVATVCIVKDIKKSNKIFVRTCIEFAASALLSCLFRNNCIYVIIPVTLALIIVLFKKAMFRVLPILLSGVVLYFGWQQCIYKVMDIEPTSINEALSIPLQQIARTVKYHSDELTQEEKDVLSQTWDLNSLADWYDPILSDPVKNNAKGADKTLMKTWVQLFFKHPLTYYEAFVAQSSGYYAFTPDYPEGMGNKNVGMTIFDWVEDGRFSEELVCHYSSSEFLNKIRNGLSLWAKLWHKIPILNLTDMKALYTWLTVLIGYIIFNRRKNDIYLIPVAGVLLMICTVIASPVNDCFRYYALAAAAFPALLALLSRDRSLQ